MARDLLKCSAYNKHSTQGWGKEDRAWIFDIVGAQSREVAFEGGNSVTGLARVAMTLNGFVAIAFMGFIVGGGATRCARRPAESASLDTQLLQAARKGDTASVRRLLKKGANIEAKDQGDSTALALAGM
jgi:hypothetical protein